MSEECGEPGCPESKPRLVCSGIWGGIRDRDQTISTDGLKASLYSSSCDGGKGGDIYYVGACKGCKLTRIAVADVVGHGQAVTDVSQFMYDSLTAHMCDCAPSAQSGQFDCEAHTCDLDSGKILIAVYPHNLLRGS